MTNPAGRQDQPPDIHPQETAPEPRKNPVRTWVTRGVIIVLVIIGLVWGINKFIYSQSHETTDDAQLAGHVVPVIPKVSGYIQRVYVSDNQPINVGDTLVVLDPRDYTVALDAAQANLRAALSAGR